MKVMALDVGEKRIGVAVSDATGLLASPVTAIESEDEPERLEAVLALAAEHEVGEIVVGLPLSLSGRTGPQARQVLRFTSVLAARTAVPVTTVDERYSTVEAQRLLRDAGVEVSRDKGRLDAAAAAVVLQSYLDSGNAKSPH